AGTYKRGRFYRTVSLCDRRRRDSKQCGTSIIFIQTYDLLVKNQIPVFVGKLRIGGSDAMIVLLKSQPNIKWDISVPAVHRNSNVRTLTLLVFPGLRLAQKSYNRRLSSGRRCSVWPEAVEFG